MKRAYVLFSAHEVRSLNADGERRSLQEPNATGFGLQGCKNLKEIEPGESVLSLPPPVTPIPLAVLPLVTPAPLSLQPLPPLPPVQPAQIAPEQPALSAAVLSSVRNDCL